MNHSRTRRSRSKQWADGVCVLLWAAAALVMVGGAACGIRGWLTRQSPVPTMRRVEVPEGGTLWNLARECRAPGQDVRALAAEIRSLNKMRPGQVLPAGAYLLVPDYRKGAAQVACRPDGG